MKGRLLTRRERGRVALSHESLQPLKIKAHRFYFSFQQLWAWVTFLWEYRTWNKPGNLDFSTFWFEGLLTSPSLRRDVSSELTVRLKLVPSTWHADACVSDTHIYLLPSLLWQISLCWISSPRNNSGCGSGQIRFIFQLQLLCCGWD